MSSNKIKSFNQNRDLCFWSMIWGWIPSVWRAVLSLFYPPVIIWGKNGKNSENPVGSNKSEKRKPKSAVYRRILASVVYFHLRIISAKNHKRKMTRNQFAGNRTRVRIPPAAPKAPEAICFWSLFLSRRRMQSRTARIIVLGRYLTYQDPQRYHLYLSALYTDITGRSVLDQLLPER